jgi:hypothetical protein
MKDERKIELVKSYFNVTFTEDFDGADIYCYNESTRDGYDVYVVTNDMNNISICEDVFYYDSDVAAALIDEITSYGGFIKVYIDMYLADEIYLDDQLLELFAENVEKIIEDELPSEEEIKELNVEYSLTEEDEN